MRSTMCSRQVLNSSAASTMPMTKASASHWYALRWKNTPSTTAMSANASWMRKLGCSPKVRATPSPASAKALQSERLATLIAHGLRPLVAQIAQQCARQRVHARRRTPFVMIVAAQMQRAVDRQPLQFPCERRAIRARLPPCGLVRNDDVAERFVRRMPVAQRERQYVGGLILAAVARIEPTHEAIVDQRDREFTSRLRANACERRIGGSLDHGVAHARKPWRAYGHPRAMSLFHQPAGV